MHNAMLIHDDIEDGSTQRRGGPTLHVRHGVPLAINAGDSLTLINMQPLIDNRALDRAAFGGTHSRGNDDDGPGHGGRSGDGAGGWRRDTVLDLDASDYLNMVLRKTCWLAAIYPTRVGALIGTRDGIDLEPFLRFGFFLGAGFSNPRRSAQSRRR